MATQQRVEHRRVPRGALAVRFDEGGTFDGYANLWDVTDSYGTRFRPGAWSAGGLDEQPYALLWMHDAAAVVGTFSAREDTRGLRIEGRFDATQAGQDARARAMSGSASELSVGFVRLENQADDDTAIIAARLVEVSLITARMASQPGAALTGVRTAPPDHLRRQVAAACLRLRGY